MLASIRTAVTPSPGRTSANTDKRRSRVLAWRPVTSNGCPGVWGRFMPLNAASGVKTRKRRRGGHDVERLLGGEGARELRQMVLPPVAGALVVPAFRTAPGV